MLVKLIALGLSPPVWKNVFHHIRMQLPEAPFAAAIFSTAEEIAYLQRDYFPVVWQRENPDFVFSEAPAGREWHQRLRFLDAVQRQPPEQRPLLVLALSALDHSLRQLIQGPYPIRLILDNGARFRISDPAMVVDAFPAGFPRLPVHDHLTRIKLRQRRGKVDEIPPLRLAQGVVLSLEELEAVEQLGERMEPQEWLRRVAKAEKFKLPRGMPLGLLREAKGLYLFPGVPVSRVRGVCVGQVEYTHLLDMGQLTPQSAHFGAVLAALQQSARRQAQRHEEFTRRLREAGAKRDLSVVCGGHIPLLNELFAERLAAAGFQRVSTLNEIREDLFREPTLLLRLTPFDAADLGAQVEPPLVFPLEEEMAAALPPLDGLPAPAAVPYVPAEPAEPLTAPQLAERKGLLLARGTRARAGRDMADKRLLLLRQEHAVLDAAVRQLAALLEAQDSLLVWNGTLPAGASQVLVFSHDQEEAGAVLQALPGVPKKRWFDLSSFTTAESIQALARAPLDEYRRDGMLVITASSRERLTGLRERLEQECAQAAKHVAEAEATLAFYQGELDKALAAQHALTRRWIRAAINDCLERKRPRLMDQLDHAARRHERQWLARAMIHRVLVIGSSAENRPALLEACRQLYPAFNEEHSVVVPYDFELLDVLPQDQADALTREAKGRGLDEAGIQARLDAVLADQNEALSDSYLGLLGHELKPMLADLILIEQRMPVAGAILDFLRERISGLKHTPAVLILPEYWAPPPVESMPWPNARVAILRRVGALTAQACEQALLTIHPA
jgi:hypothetical protein